MNMINFTAAVEQLTLMERPTPQHHNATTEQLSHNKPAQEDEENIPKEPEEGDDSPLSTEATTNSTRIPNNVCDLRARLKSLGLYSSGDKTTLKTRLRKYYKSPPKPMDVQERRDMFSEAG